MARSKAKKGKVTTELQLGQPPPPPPPPPALAAAVTPPDSVSTTGSLIICRNKHWRYISSFHGPWLQLPPEVLEALAYNNYAAPRPRPIDVAVLFDMVRIRRYVDEATSLAVRAAAGVAGPPVGSGAVPEPPVHHARPGHSHGYHHGHAPHHHHRQLFGGGGGHGPAARLSRERKHRMRELATHKLARAYALDEVAAAVATMQSASALEDVARLVLARDPQNADATYVHFFHEKIPSRMLARCTPLAALDLVVADRPADAAALRTRAVTRVIKGDLSSAAADLTAALAVASRLPHHAAVSAASSATAASASASAPAPLHSRSACLRDEEMPSSLETQLLFHRAGAHLALAVRAAERVLASTAAPAAAATAAPAAVATAAPAAAANAATAATDCSAADRRAVRTHAKRALRDYSRFLALFEYSPSYSGSSSTTSSSSSTTSSSSTNSPTTAGSSAPIYTVAALLSSDGPALPPPSDNECVCYHPLLTDAMYAVLLTHALLATPPKELARHEATVARLARIADGYPVFLAARSPAHADWCELARLGALNSLDAETATATMTDAIATACVEQQLSRLNGEYPVAAERAGTVSRWLREGLGGVAGLKKRASRPEVASAVQAVAGSTGGVERAGSSNGDAGTGAA